MPVFRLPAAMLSANNHAERWLAHLPAGVMLPIRCIYTSGRERYSKVAAYVFILRPAVVTVAP